MPTPVMLHPLDPRPDPGTRGDPIASAVVVLLVAVAAGLFVAGALAVYDWTTPATEGPLVSALTALFAVALGTSILAASVRALRRIR